ncbi:type II secretion system protein [bacterium]|nr:type II secretion system protein [bacterium]
MKIFGKKIFAFTMAEVLVTMATIGTIAVLTYPTLQRHNTDTASVARARKLYSVLNQAYARAQLQSGGFTKWNATTSTKLAEKFKPYLKLALDCGTTQQCEMPTYKYLNGNVHNANYNSTSYYKMILEDGSFIWMRPSFSPAGKCQDTESGYANQSCGVIFFDTNSSKPPNIIGKDMFIFVILEDSIVPNRMDDCYYNSTGWGCTYQVIFDGNMKYRKTK